MSGIRFRKAAGLDSIKTTLRRFKTGKRIQDVAD
jgi:hypothetical protein